MNYLLRVEGVNFANFVTDTQDLSTIRGGGLLLLSTAEGLAEGLRHEVPSIRQVEEVTSGASIGVYEIEMDDENEEQNIREGTIRWLGQQQALRYATVVVDVHRVGDGLEFAEMVQALTARNRWQQMQSLSIALDQESSERVCQIDNVRPAYVQKEIKGKNLWISQSVLARRSYGSSMKQRFYEKETGRTLHNQFVFDLDELSNNPEKANLHHKIAIIHLDGNRFGEIKARAGNSREAWEGFDKAVKRYRRQMLEGLLDIMTGDDDWKTADGQYRLETLLWGGDEIVWVVPAWKGWEMLSYFYRSSESWSFQDQPLRHAGAVIFCHHNAPIHRLTKLVQELAEQAKQNNGRDHDRFAYEVLESFDHAGGDFPGYRQSRSVQPLELEPRADAQLLVLNAGEMSLLQDWVKDTQEQMPRRKLHDVADELLTPFAMAGNESEAQYQFRLTQRRKQREDAITDLKTRLAKAGVASSRIQELEQRFGGEVCWIHLNNLWDYLA